MSGYFLLSQVAQIHRVLEGSGGASDSFACYQCVYKGEVALLSQAADIHTLPRQLDKASKRVETCAHLRLDRVERLETLVQGLKLRVPQRGDGQRLQVQQLGGGRVLLRQDQVAERHGENRLARQPLV